MFAPATFPPPPLALAFLTISSPTNHKNLNFGCRNRLLRDDDSMALLCMTQDVTMSGIPSVVHAALVPARLFVAAQA